MLSCSTNKVCYQSFEEALEALISFRGRNNYAPNTGPINVYQCDFCQSFHFTSKGAVNPALLSDEVSDKMKKQNEATYWQDKFKK